MHSAFQTRSVRSLIVYLVKQMIHRFSVCFTLFKGWLSTRTKAAQMLVAEVRWLPLFSWRLISNRFSFPVVQSVLHITVIPSSCLAIATQVTDVLHCCSKNGDDVSINNKNSECKISWQASQPWKRPQHCEYGFLMSVYSRGVLLLVYFWHNCLCGINWYIYHRQVVYMPVVFAQLWLTWDKIMLWCISGIWVVWYIWWSMVVLIFGGIWVVYG